RVDSAGSTAFYLGDRQGSIRGITDNLGDLIDQIGYDAFGNIRSESNPSAGDQYKWQGGMYDAATGLCHFGARDENPLTAQWMQEDPSGFADGSSNLRRFVGNDPTNFTDPSGLSEDPVFDRARADAERMISEGPASERASVLKALSPEASDAVLTLILFEQLAKEYGAKADAQGKATSLQYRDQVASEQQVA